MSPSPTARPLILLSNDDGYLAPGIDALRAELGTFADVVVCAPRTNQSASSHSLTLAAVLRLTRVDEHLFAVDGTPADCVYVALHSGTRLLPRWPDMVVSGMNAGPNLGVDVIYSGTVAAAREGAQRGIPAVAISADVLAQRFAAARLGASVVASLWRRIVAAAVQPTPLFNVNIPEGEKWQLLPTRLGRRLYEDDVIYRDDPRGREYLWIGGSKVRHDRTDGTDTGAWEAGHASVTPLSLDLFEADHEELTRELVGEPAVGGSRETG